MFESPNTQPQWLLEHHRRQRAGSSKTMFESPNTQPRMLLEDHRRQRDGSSNTMFESPNTQPRRVQQNHLRVQERPATITPKASALLINLTKKKKLHINHHIWRVTLKVDSFRKMTNYIHTCHVHVHVE